MRMRRECDGASQEAKHQRDGDTQAGNSILHDRHFLTSSPSKLEWWCTGWWRRRRWWRWITASANRHYCYHRLAYRTRRWWRAARTRHRSREQSMSAGRRAVERNRSGHRQRTGRGCGPVAWQRRFVARTHVLTRVGARDWREVDGPLIHGNVGISLASLVTRPYYVFGVRGIEFRPAHRRYRVRSMHLVICCAARRRIHHRS